MFPFINGTWLNWPLVKAVIGCCRYDRAVQHRAGYVLAVGARRSRQRLDLRRSQAAQTFGGGRARARAAAGRDREGDARRLGELPGDGASLTGQQLSQIAALEQAGGERRHHVDAGVAPRPRTGRRG